MEESDEIGGKFVGIDGEIDKIIASVLKIEELLDSVDGEPVVRKLRDILDNGISPYVAEFGDLLNKMDET